MARSKAGNMIKLAGGAVAVMDLRNSLILRALQTNKPERSVKSQTHKVQKRAITIKTTREFYRLSRGDSKIRLSLDVCLVEAPENRRAVFSEAVFTLKEGDSGDLFQIVRLVMEEGRHMLRVSTAPRQTTAIAALGAPFTLQKISPGKQDSVSDVLAAALFASLQDITALVPMVVDQRSPIGLRKMRVALRRFRSLENLFRKSGAAPGLRSLSRQAAVFARALGEARDWDVFVDETLQTIANSAAAPKGFGKLTKSAEDCRMKAWQEAADVIASDQFSEFLLIALETAHKLRRKVGSAKQQTPIVDYAPMMLDRLFEKARECAADLPDKPPSAGHPLRIAIKRLRFSARTFRDLYPAAATKPYLAALAQLQDRFGIMNDAVVAQTLALKAAEGQGAKAIRASGFVSGYRGAEAHAAAVKLVDEWAAFEKTAPFWRKS